MQTLLPQKFESPKEMEENVISVSPILDIIGLISNPLKGLLCTVQRLLVFDA